MRGSISPCASRAAHRAEGYREFQRTPILRSCEVSPLNVVGLTMLLVPSKVPEIAGQAVAHIEIAICEFDGEIRRDLVRKTCVKRPGEIPSRQVSANPSPAALRRWWCPGR